MRSTMTVGKWYGSSLKVPGYTHDNYRYFLASCLGIVRSVVKRKVYDKPIRIHFTAENTASADQKKGLINISTNLAYGATTAGPVKSETAIGMVMGLVVHEAGHFAYSPPTLEIFAKYVKDHTPNYYHQGLAATVANVIEDVYIEAELGRDVPSLAWTLDVVNGVFFSDEAYKDAVEKAIALDTPPTGSEGISDILNLLIYAKTRETVVTNPWLSELFDLVRTAVDLDKLEQRMALTLDVYNRITANLVDVPAEDAPGKGEGQEGQESGPSGESMDKEVKDVKEMGEGEGDTNKHGLTDSINRTLDSFEDKEIEVLDADERSLKKGKGSSSPLLVFEQSLAPIGEAVTLDSRYTRLSEAARQRATVNRPYGLDHTRGHNIRKLHRIATDGKIFAETVRTKSYKPMQVTILVDCSASMLYNHCGGGRSALVAAAEATLGAATALAEARCEVAVYGHTADLGIGDYCLNIYTLKTFDTSVADLHHRLAHLVKKSNTLCCENRDGDAVQYVGKKFRGSDKRQLLIVISDGSPSAGSYGGMDALDHTKFHVDALRSRGVDVLSISITTDANYANNHIYGLDHNFYNEDPALIDSIIRKLVLA